jgi:hypothetical protein
VVAAAGSPHKAAVTTGGRGFLDGPEPASRGLALLARFRPDGKGHKAIFNGDRAPLSTFAARISVGYALRIFGTKTLGDLESIKTVRNSFAHSLMTFDFTTPQIVTVCNALVSWTKAGTIADGGSAVNAKEKYIRSASYIAGGLKRIALMSAQDIQRGRHFVWPATTELWCAWLRRFALRPLAEFRIPNHSQGMR